MFSYPLMASSCSPCSYTTFLDKEGNTDVADIEEKWTLMHNTGQHGTTAFSSPSKPFPSKPSKRQNILKQLVHLIQKGQDEDSLLDDQISSPLSYWWPGNVLYSWEPVFPSANITFITLKKLIANSTPEQPVKLQLSALQPSTAQQHTTNHFFIGESRAAAGTYADFEGCVCQQLFISCWATRAVPAQGKRSTSRTEVLPSSWRGWLSRARVTVQCWRRSCKLEVPLARCKCTGKKKKNKNHKTQRAGTKMVFSTAAEHFVKMLCNKKQEELLAIFTTHAWLVLQSPGPVPCILEHHLLAFCLLTHSLHENKDRMAQP